MSTYFSDPTFLIGLAITQTFLYIAALIVTWRPVVTVFHLYLGVQILATGIKPLFDIAQGEILYSSQSGWDGYGLGLLYQLLFNLLIILSYLVARSYRGVPKNRSFINCIRYREFFLSFVIGAIAVAFIHFLSDGAWLMRLVSSDTRNLTMAVPLGKYIFPVAAIGLSAVIPMAFLLLQKPGRWIERMLVLGVAAVAAVFLILLYQRGFLLIGIVVSLWLYERLRGLSLGKLLVGFIVLMALLSIARPFANGIVAYFTKDSLSESTSGFLTKTNPLERFDTLDAWALTVDAVQEQGFQLGKTLLAVPARFLPGQERRYYELYTSSDIVNYNYLKEFYWDKGFGIGINFLQEQYVNFGALATCLGVVIGLIMWFFDKRLYSLRNIWGSAVIIASLFYFTNGFTGEISAGIQWVLAYALFALGLRLSERFRLLPKGGRFETPLSHHSR